MSKSSIKKKYDLIETDHFTAKPYKLKQVRALIDIPRYNVKVGDLGGFVEDEHILSHDGDCWIGNIARAYKGTSVRDNAFLTDGASIAMGTVLSGNCFVGFMSDVLESHIGGNVDIIGECSVKKLNLNRNELIQYSSILNSNNNTIKIFMNTKCKSNKVINAISMFVYKIIYFSKRELFYLKKRILTQPSNKKKYELIEVDDIFFGSRKLKQVRALIDIPRHNVRAGDLGGFVENEYILSHDGDCWIGKKSEAYKGTFIQDNALLTDHSVIAIGTILSGNCSVREWSEVVGCNIGGNVNIVGKGAVSELNINGDESIKINEDSDLL